MAGQIRRTPKLTRSFIRILNPVQFGFCQVESDFFMSTDANEVWVLFGMNGYVMDKSLHGVFTSKTKAMDAALDLAKKKDLGKPVARGNSNMVRIDFPDQLYGSGDYMKILRWELDTVDEDHELC